MIEKSRATAASAAAEDRRSEAGAGKEGQPKPSRRSNERTRARGAEVRPAQVAGPARGSARQLDLDKAAQTKNLTGKVDETRTAERSLITSKVGASSGGINTANRAAATAAARDR